MKIPVIVVLFDIASANCFISADCKRSGAPCRHSLHVRQREAEFGVGDCQDQHVLLVLFERDQVGEPLDGGLADQRADCAHARPCR